MGTHLDVVKQGVEAKGALIRFFLEARCADVSEIEGVFDSQDLVGLRLSSETFTLEFKDDLSVVDFTMKTKHPVAVKWYSQKGGWGDLMSSSPVIA